MITNANGGIIDDCIVTRTGPDSFFIVANAGCAEKDLAHLKVPPYIQNLCFYVHNAARLLAAMESQSNLLQDTQ